MKKRFGFVLVVMALLVMVCLPAMAEEDDEGQIIDTRWSAFVLTRGETRTVEWPNFVSYIDWSLDESDFDVTYEINPEAKFWVNPDKTITVAEDAPLTNYFSYSILVTYTPKVEGKGTKTTFKGISASIYEPVTEIKAPDEVTMYMDDESLVEFYFGENTYDYIVNDYSFNRSIIQTQKVNTTKRSTQILKLVPQGYGKTDLTVTVYNGLSKTVPVSVVRHPSYVKFGSDYFSCMEGETVDVGTDFGNGSVSLQQPMSMWVNDQHYPEHIFSSYVNSFFVGDLAHFKAKAGMYEITLITVNGHQGTVRVDVFSDAVCTELKVESTEKMLLERTEENYVYLYDENGQQISRPMQITKGEELAELQGNKLIARAYGEIEITVTNPDGSTYAETLEILPNPTALSLNATELTLEVGDVFDFEISFDKGTLPHNYDLEFDNPWPEYGLFPLKQEKLRITAQAPGTATFKVWTYRGERLETTCRITVLDNEKALTFDLPTNLGIGETDRIRVCEKGGKEVAATFKIKAGADVASLTEDGVITGKSSGTAEILATLADGRQMTTWVSIVKKPAWLRHSAIILRMGKKEGLALTSDVGAISYAAVDVTVEDPRIVSYEKGVFTPLQVGKTGVTVKSKITDASTSFSVEVIRADSTTYVGMGEVYLPYGFTMNLDALYNAVELDWWISHDNPGAGNPAESGFEIADDKLTCTWPTASCEVTGMSKNGGTKVKVTVYGYKLPEAIRIEPETLTLSVGERYDVSVLFDEPGAEVQQVYWVADTEGVIGLTEVTEGATNTFWGAAPGTTLVMAFLDNGAYALCMVTVVDPNYDPSVRLPGDANVDGSVNILDALRILQYCVGWNVEINLSNSDVDADGAVTIEDALRVLQYDAGWEVELL